MALVLKGIINSEHDGSPVEAWGVTVDDMFIYDPRRSECGRFEVEPVEYYGITPFQADQIVQLNTQLNIYA